MTEPYVIAIDGIGLLSLAAMLCVLLVYVASWAVMTLRASRLGKTPAQRCLSSGSGLGSPQRADLFGPISASSAPYHEGQCRTVRRIRLRDSSPR